MAGVAGIFGKSADEQTLTGMLDMLSHRGPDTRKTRIEAEIAAGITAASLSPARGDGFAREDGVTVFIDGEIHNPRTDGLSDAEVVLRLFSRYGRAFPGHVEGPFVCALLDERALQGAPTELLLVRDSLGVRPLYWGTTSQGSFCFASEMKALGGVAAEMFELHPGTTWSSECGVSAYLVSHKEVALPQGFDETASLVRDTLTEAIRRRLEDGAVGACLLSGGLDSSIIAAVANEIRPGLPAVTVGLAGAPDLDNARLMAEHLGVEHLVSIFDREDVERMVPRAVRMLESFDEDCVSGAISNLFGSELAATRTNCILSGEGGDELFGGYHLLKDLATDVDRLEMMKRLIDISYNTALQRLDRSMMANSITYRTPFLDSDVITLACQLPVQWKISPRRGGFIEKHILREAFKDILPEQIYRREKLRFAAGTGTDSITDQIASGHVTQQEFREADKKTPAGYIIASPKEMWYYKLFKEALPSPYAEQLVGRWDPGK